MIPSHLKMTLPDGRVIVQIGVCAGRVEAADHVELLLTGQGIQPFIHGSRVYAIAVVESAIERARTLLQADPEKAHYGIKLYDY